MHKRKRQELFNALMDLKTQVFLNKRNMTREQRQIIRRNIKSIEKTLDDLFFTV